MTDPMATARLNGMTEDILRDLQGAYEGVPRGVHAGQQYAQAPIIEAAVTIATEPRDTDAVGLDDLATVIAAVGLDNPEPVYSREVGKWESDRRTEERAQVGYAARLEGQFGIRIKADLFGFSWLDKYVDWDRFVQKAESCWSPFREAVAPRSVQRVSVRFVNLIPLPDRPIEITDYLRTSFQLSPYLPQVAESFFCQVSVPLKVPDEPTVMAVITVAPSNADLILDIETSCELDIDTRAEDFSASLTEVLTKLRHAKNFVFEACITDATRNVIS